LDAALLHSSKSQVEGELRLDLKDVLAGPPEVEIRVEPPVPVIDDALDERRMKIPESPVGQTSEAMQSRSGRRATDLDREAPVAPHAERVAADQPIQIVEVEPYHLDCQCSWCRGRHLAVDVDHPGAVRSEERQGSHRRGGIG